MPDRGGVPPSAARAVATLASFRLSAIFRSESPRARWRWIRRTTVGGSLAGRPSLTPPARLTASASFVRFEITGPP